MITQRPLVLRWLIFGYAAFASFVAAWLMSVNLRRGTAAVVKSTPKLGGRNTLKRTNATITIRNGTTQQAESTDRVATRRLFKARRTAKTSTPVLASPAVTVTAAPHEGFELLKNKPSPALVPTTPPSISPATVAKTRPTPAARPDANDHAPTSMTPARAVIGTHASILLEPEFDDSLPETTDVRISSR